MKIPESVEDMQANCFELSYTIAKFVVDKDLSIEDKEKMAADLCSIVYRDTSVCLKTFIMDEHVKHGYHATSSCHSILD